MKYKFLFGLSYTIIYLYLAFVNAGAGHGTFTFFTPLITWIFFLIALFLVGDLKESRRRIFFVVSMVLHYLFILILPVSFDPGLEKLWNRYPHQIFLIVAWYLLGQIIIWILFFRAIKDKTENKEFS